MKLKKKINCYQNIHAFTIFWTIWTILVVSAVKTRVNDPNGRIFRYTGTSKNPPVRISVPKIYVSQPSSVKKGVVRTNNPYVVYFTELIMHHVKAYKRCDFLSSFFISAFFLCRISCKIQFLFSFLLLSDARCVRLHFFNVVSNLFWKIYSLYVFTTILK